MKPTATLEDYQNREKFLIRHIESQIRKCETNVLKYPSTSLVEDVRVKAYKDILFKLMKDE